MVYGVFLWLRLDTFIWQAIRRDLSIPWILRFFQWPIRVFFSPSWRGTAQCVKMLQFGWYFLMQTNAWMMKYWSLTTSCIYRDCCIYRDILTKDLQIVVYLCWCEHPNFKNILVAYSDQVPAESMESPGFQGDGIKPGTREGSTWSLIIWMRKCCLEMICCNSVATYIAIM